jgi:putative membrane protein
MTEPGKGAVISGFRHNRFLQGLLLWLVGLWVAMAIEPFDRGDWLLENVLVFVYAILLIATYPRFRFSNLSYGLFGLFLSLHLVGAHYTYSETPFGFWLQETFDLSRNHYDRIVHFSFGLLIAYPFREFLLRVTGMRVGWSYLFAVVTVLAFSSFYEALEGAAAVVVSPELGMAFLGTQGDIWDAQKDTALAFVGSIAAMGITRLITRVHSGR